MSKKNQLSEVFAEAVCEGEDVALIEEDKFNEVFAQSVYEGLSWMSKLVAPVLQIYLHDAITPEVGLRKAKLNIRDAEILEEGLERLFGFGAKVVEYKILQILYINLRLNEKVTQNFKFSVEVKKAKKIYKTKLGVDERPTSGK